MSLDAQDLGEPKPPAWAYIAIPSLYPHAGSQWSERLRRLAEREGFAIGRWHQDMGWRRDGLTAMIQALPQSGIKALLVPHISMLAGIDDLIVRSGAGVYSTLSAVDERQRLSMNLHLPIFVLGDEYPTIIPPHAQALVEAATAAPTPARGVFLSRRRWLRRPAT